MTSSSLSRETDISSAICLRSAENLHHLRKFTKEQSKEYVRTIEIALREMSIAIELDRVELSHLAYHEQYLYCVTPLKISTSGCQRIKDF